MGEITIERKKGALGARACAALVELVGGIAGAELARRLEMPRRLSAVLRGYEGSDPAAARRAGRLTFADVWRRLLPEGDGPLLTRDRAAGPGAGEARLLIEGRLDAKFDYGRGTNFRTRARRRGACCAACSTRRCRTRRAGGASSTWAM